MGSPSTLVDPPSGSRASEVGLSPRLCAPQEVISGLPHFEALPGVVVTAARVAPNASANCLLPAKAWLIHPPRDSSASNIPQRPVAEQLLSNDILWSLVSEPGAMGFPTFKIFRCPIKKRVYTYRRKINKGVLERPWTKRRVLRGISSTLKFQYFWKS